MAKSYRAYAGIGSRETPADILLLMTEAAAGLEGHGLTLRSGAADGADQAFEAGVHNPDLKEIYIPWPGFANRYGDHPGVYSVRDCNLEDAVTIAGRYHPAWDRLSSAVQKLMIRNTFQVLGNGCDRPAQFVLCWTKGGRGQGGTGQAIRIARAYDIPVFDFGGMSVEDIVNGINAIID